MVATARMSYNTINFIEHGNRVATARMSYNTINFIEHGNRVATARMRLQYNKLY